MVFSVNFGLSVFAKTTFNKSETNTKSKQVPKTNTLYKIGLFVSDALVPMAAVHANQNKKTFGLSVFIK